MRELWRRGELGLPAAVAGLAALVWLVPLRIGWYRDAAISDIPTYRRAGRAIADGLVPYRDFSLEYPPLAAALFAIPELLPGGYAATFSALMLCALIATAVGAVATARVAGFPPDWQAAAGVVVALSPLALGSLVETRFDLLVAALLTWTVFAALTGRWRLAWSLVAVGVLIKLVALLLVPVLIVHHLHRSERADVARVVGRAALIMGVGFLPFMIVAPGGTLDMAGYHLERPLQIESTGAAYLMSLHELAGIPLLVESSFGSQGLVGDGPRIIAALSSAALAGLVIAIALTFRAALRRAHATGEARLMLAASAATIAAGLAAGKVLSPQFMIWLLPFALLVGGRYGRAAFGITVAALIATALYFPRQYWDLVDLETWPIITLIARDALLIALVAAAWPRPSIGAPTPSVELPPSATAPLALRSPAGRYLTG